MRQACSKLNSRMRDEVQRMYLEFKIRVFSMEERAGWGCVWSQGLLCPKMRLLMTALSGGIMGEEKVYVKGLASLNENWYYYYCCLNIFGSFISFKIDTNICSFLTSQKSSKDKLSNIKQEVKNGRCV